MHDILEGCLQYEVKELIKYLVLQLKVISLSMLNYKIESFPYGYIDSPNKPSLISATSLNSPDHTLKQTGTCKQWNPQMWTNMGPCKSALIREVS